MRRLARHVFTWVAHGDGRFYFGAAACFLLGTGLILCHTFFLPKERGLAMVSVFVGTVVAILSGVIAAIPLLRWSKRTERVKAGLCPTCGYDLRASPERCPECGASAATVAVR